MESAATVVTSSSFRSFSPSALSVAPNTPSREQSPWTGKEAGRMLTWNEEWGNLREKVQWPRLQIQSDCGDDNGRRW